MGTLRKQFVLLSVPVITVSNMPEKGFMAKIDPNNTDFKSHFLPRRSSLMSSYLGLTSDSFHISIKWHENNRCFLSCVREVVFYTGI